MYTPKEGYVSVDLHNAVLVYKSFYVILPVFGRGDVNCIGNTRVPLQRFAAI